MPGDARLPEWRLPQGVTRGTWRYAQSEAVARGYDDELSASPLFEFDQEVLRRYITCPGLVVDLGCGTGRALVPLARRGCWGVGVDLSRPMLAVLGEKAAAERLRIDRLVANLVELGCLRDEVADYALLLFSTLGMIRGRENRQKVLGHAWRILKPGGLLVVHVHNRWSNLATREGRAWLWQSSLAAWRGEAEPGDKFFDYRDVPKMYLHLYTQGELIDSLRGAGFRVEELIPLAAGQAARLPAGWLLGSARASGWIAVCRKSGA